MTTYIPTRELEAERDRYYAQRDERGLDGYGARILANIEAELADRAVSALAERRAELATPAERIAFDNDPANGPIAVRIAAALESR